MGTRGECRGDSVRLLLSDNVVGWGVEGSGLVVEMRIHDLRGCAIGIGDIGAVEVGAKGVMGLFLMKGLEVGVGFCVGG